jgi:hypothetical protein
MAARKNLSHSDKTRERIKTSMLINRLTSFVEGSVELNPAQVTAALGLMKKTLPDLTTTTIEGGDNPLKTTTRIELVALDDSAG